jgi:signal transduction histidine kinase
MERAVRFSEMFIGILGHDLRNPINAISMAASLILHGAPEQQAVVKPANRILSSAARMERMISQLLDFTRVRLGRGIPLERSRVDLAEVCRATIGELETATGCAVQFEQEGDPNGNWDRDRLAQLISNLVANACLHGKQGSPATVRLNGTEPERVLIDVRNQGAVPAELMPMLFEPLHKARAHKPKQSRGLGLGLYITQQIVLAHGGEIRVESDESRGTRFVVELPRLPPAEADRVFGSPTRTPGLE